MSLTSVTPGLVPDVGVVAYNTARRFWHSRPRLSRGRRGRRHPRSWRCRGLAPPGVYPWQLGTGAALLSRLPASRGVMMTDHRVATTVIVVIIDVGGLTAMDGFGVCDRDRHRRDGRHRQERRRSEEHT